MGMAREGMSITNGNGRELDKMRLILGSGMGINHWKWEGMGSIK